MEVSIVIIHFLDFHRSYSIFHAAVQKRTYRLSLFDPFHVCNFVGRDVLTFACASIALAFCSWTRSKYIAALEEQRDRAGDAVKST